MNVKINLLSLAASLIVWNYAFPKDKNRLVSVLETIPAYGDLKKNLMRDAFVSVLQVAALYAISEQVRKRV